MAISGLQAILLKPCAHFKLPPYSKTIEAGPLHLSGEIQFKDQVSLDMQITQSLMKELSEINEAYSLLYMPI